MDDDLAFPVTLKRVLALEEERANARAKAAEEREMSDVPALLRGMAETFETRNATYADNYKLVGPLVKVLFPDGLPPEILHSDHWHIFELKLVKLTRFVRSGLTHIDSIHDDAVYSVMIESILRNKGKESDE